MHEWYGGRPVTDRGDPHAAPREPPTRSPGASSTSTATPIGFLQFYEYIEEWKQAIDLAPDEEAWGIDVYLGEPHLHGQGIGTRLVRGVAERLAAGPGARPGGHRPACRQRRRRPLLPEGRLPEGAADAFLREGSRRVEGCLVDGVATAIAVIVLAD